MDSLLFRDGVDLLPKGARVLVGMSGGVDSSVAAALLAERGLDVVGISLHLWDYAPGGAAPSRCCAPEDLDDARRSAATLGIPHFTFDRTRDFAGHVVDPFVDAYLSGTTPSPCVACNREVKIASFLALADKLGAVAFATGHYARAGRLEGRPALLRAHDAHKDQSYFLHGIGSAALGRLLTPLGGMTKDVVRGHATRLGLHNASKPDSEDLCFTAGDHAEFVERRAHDRIRPGPIVDADGRELGRHEGVHRFTIGQRKGLGVALGKPAFVAGIDPETSTVRLGDLRELESRDAWVHQVAWLDDRPLEGARRVTAKVRYRHEGALAVVEPLGKRAGPAEGRVLVRFEAPIRAITPGQTCVFYDGDQVLGGGTIGRSPGNLTTREVVVSGTAITVEGSAP